MEVTGVGKREDLNLSLLPSHLVRHPYRRPYDYADQRVFRSPLSVSLSLSVGRIWEKSKRNRQCLLSAVTYGPEWDETETHIQTHSDSHSVKILKYLLLSMHQ